MSLCQLLPQLGSDRPTDLGKETGKRLSPSKPVKSVPSPLLGDMHSTQTNRIQLLNWHTAWHIVHAQ